MILLSISWVQINTKYLSTSRFEPVQLMANILSSDKWWLCYVAVPCVLSADKVLIYMVNSLSEPEDTLWVLEDLWVKFCLELDFPGVVWPLLTTGEIDGDLVARGDKDGVKEGVMTADVRLDS